MDVTTYQTNVVFLPALRTRSRLMPAQWSVMHLCSRCYDYVITGQLVAHAQMHANAPSGDEDFHSGEPSGTMAPERLDRCEDSITPSNDPNPPMTTTQRRR
jgi:hypothetical protein